MRKLLIFSTLLLLLSCSEKKGDYPIKPVPFTAVELTDDFWKPKILKNHEVTIPIAFGHCESTGRIKNFEVAGGLTEGSFSSKYPFDDSDVFKIIEGASYSLQTFPDAVLEQYLDSLIYKIGMAQEDDGYLYTNRTILGDSGHPWIGRERWELTHELSHELYNLGHLFEAAVAHYQATGKRSLLDIAIKAADLVDRDFGWDGLVTYPGHQEIEIGLVKLYRVTGDERYLDLARFFLDARRDGPEYCQAHKPVIEQSEAVGHAVRATYMYSAIADIAAITNDEQYINAITEIWKDIIYRKIYVTGGIGATGGNEGFGEPYHLPNMTAYCETCASIGNIFMNHRLFLLHGDSKYYDVLERTLYNAMLSGVSLSADRFFYPNPLESEGQHKRSEWFGCACCPSNISRFLPSVPGYVYAIDKDGIFVNLYMSGEADIQLDNTKVKLIQSTDYPWDGIVVITVIPEYQRRFDLKLRIPGWALNEAIDGDLYVFMNDPEEAPELFINGNKVRITLDNGYVVISRKWKFQDQVVLNLPMPVRKVAADDRVEADRGRVAFQRGPVIYCAEWADNRNGRVLDLMVDEDASTISFFKPDLLSGTQVVFTDGIRKGQPADSCKVTLIPYHLWNNRGPGEMAVWLPTGSGTKD